MTTPSPYEPRVLDLRGLLARTSPYEAWQVPVDPALRRASLLGVGGGTLSALAAAQASGLAQLAGQMPLIVLGEALQTCLGAIAQSNTALIVSAGALLIQLAGIVLTAGLRRGRLIWHWLLLTGALATALPTALLCALMAIVMLNITIFVCAILAVLLAGGRLLRGRSAA